MKITSVSLAGFARWRQVGWLIVMIAVFMLIYLGLQFLALHLRLPPLGAAALGQFGILAVALVFSLLDGGGIRSLGVTARWRSFDLGLVVAILGVHVLGSLGAAAVLTRTDGEDLQSVAGPVLGLLKSFGEFSTGNFVLIALGLAILSGVTEELLFRGYLITRLERIGLGALPCVVLSALIFGLVHWPGYGLLSSMSKALFFGIPTGLYFWYRRNLGPLAFAHALMNFTGFMVAHLIGRYMPGLPGF